jgi:hypothetical protein
MDSHARSKSWVCLGQLHPEVAAFIEFFCGFFQLPYSTPLNEIPAAIRVILNAF